MGFGGGLVVELGSVGYLVCEVIFYYLLLIF